MLALTRPDGSTIFLLNRGEAVNFVHGAVIGEYVYLVLAEIIEGVRQLALQPLAPVCSTCRNRPCAPLPATGWPTSTGSPSECLFLAAIDGVTT